MLMVILIVVVAACLAVGLSVGAMWLVWCALISSVLGSIVVGAVALRRRKGAAADVDPAPASAMTESTSLIEGYPGVGEASTAEGAANPAKTTAAAEASPSGGTKNVPVADKPEAPAGDTPAGQSVIAAGNGGASSESPASSEIPASGEAKVLNGDHAVRVVPGGRRFHVAGCRLLEGKSAEEINLEEAQEEGFSACTTCIPRREVLAHSG